ncbi:MAG: LysR family transcriptional regulator [Pseudomonadota bacterium]
MSRALPSLNLLRAFEAAGRTLNFRLAAEALSVTPSAISHQVRELEEQLGVPLFVRTPRALSFTPEGERYFAEVGRAMDLLRAATAALSPVTEVPLKVSTVPLLDADVMAPVLGTFLREHPDFRIVLEGDWKTLDIAAGEADIGIRIMPQPAPDSIPLCPVRTTLVCAPSLRGAVLDGVPDSFARQTSYRLTGFEQTWPNWCSTQGWPPVTGHTVMLNNYRGLLAATAQAHGITLGVFPFVIDWLEDGRLVAPLPRHWHTTGQLCIVVRDAVRRRRDVVDFIAWVRELVRGMDRRTDEFFSSPPG